MNSFAFETARAKIYEILNFLLGVGICCIFKTSICNVTEEKGMELSSLGTGILIHNIFVFSSDGTRTVD